MLLDNVFCLFWFSFRDRARRVLLRHCTIYDIFHEGIDDTVDRQRAKLINIIYSRGWMKLVR